MNQSILQQMINQANAYRQESVASNSKKTYESAIRKFKEFLSSINEDHRVNAEKILAYVVYLKDSLKITYPTIRTHIAAIAYHCRNTNQPDFTKDIRVKELKRGLLRLMNGNAAPKRKTPILKENLLEMITKKPPITVEDYKMFFLMSIQFFGFLRISEALALVFENIKINDENQIEIFIQSSKIDQTGFGTTVFIEDGKQQYSPFRFIEVALSNTKPGEKVFPKSRTIYSKKLDSLISMINLDPKLYGFHSFRHAGAYAAACSGVEDSVIKTQGRWASECFTIYVRVQPQRAGKEISSVL